MEGDLEMAEIRRIGNGQQASGNRRRASGVRRQEKDGTERRAQGAGQNVIQYSFPPRMGSYKNPLPGGVGVG